MEQGVQARPDPGLKAQLPVDAFETLAAWCNDMGVSIDLRDWLDGGHSRASVALVGLRGAGPYRDAVLKYCPAKTDEPQRDFKAFRAAAESGPKGFAQAHLVQLDRVSEKPIRNGHQGIFLIMEYPTGTYYRHVSMATLLGFTSLASACRSILPEILKKWNNVHRTLEQERGTIRAHDFLQEILGTRCNEGRPIRLAVEAIEGGFPDIYLTKTGAELPRPLAAALSGQGVENIYLPGLRGNGHGDLHVDNILIPTPAKDGPPTPKDFRKFLLIDLSTFDANRLLAVDPTHLQLSIVARSLSNMTEQDRENLADLVLAPDIAEIGTIPTGLAHAIQAIHAAGIQLANERHQYPGWHMECLAATAACALLFVGRDGIDDADRRWFLRLAARAVSLLREEAADSAPKDAGPGTPAPSRARQVDAKVIPITKAVAERLDPQVPSSNTAYAKEAPANVVPAPTDNRIDRCVLLVEELVNEIRDLAIEKILTAPDAATATTYARVITEDLADELDGMRRWHEIQRPELHLVYTTAIGITELQLTRLRQTLDGARHRALDRIMLDDLLQAAEALAGSIGDIRRIARPGKSLYP